MADDYLRFIFDTFNNLEDLMPDVSTEHLFALTMDACGCDYDDVTEAVVLFGDDEYL